MCDAQASVTTPSRDGGSPSSLPAVAAGEDRRPSRGHIVQRNLKDIGGAVAVNLRGFGQNLRNNVNNMRSRDFSHPGARKQWRQSLDDSGIYRIRSVRKLLDVVEQRYSHVAIVLLLINTALEALAVGIFLVVQAGSPMKSFYDFDWGMPCFIILSVLSAIFTLSWVGLLSVEAKKWSYLVKPTSLMTYATGVWMLVLMFGALFSGGNLAWTRVYCPMYLRIWWLHGCVLTLLDYPQVALYFTENRLEMTRSLIQCFAVIGISVGTLQAVESYGGDPVGFFNMVYMMLVTFSTIGYGDACPITVPGRLLLIVFICIGISYFVPLLQYVANLGVQHLLYSSYSTWLKRSNHIVLCGSFGYSDLHLQLKNIFSGSRHYYNVHVVVLVSAQSSADVLLLLNSPEYVSSVTLLVGDPGKMHDLDRCNARGASAIFLFGAGANSSYFSDYDVARQAMTVALHIPHVPLYVLLHRSRYTRSVMPKNAVILELERLNYSLLGLGCVLPGTIPLLGNLLRVFEAGASVNLWTGNEFNDPRTGALAMAKAVSSIGIRQRELHTYTSLYSHHDTAVTTAAQDEEGSETEVPWRNVYEASLAQQFEVVDFPESQASRTFQSLARELYKHAVTAVGVVRLQPQKQPKSHSAPHKDKFTSHTTNAATIEVKMTPAYSGFIQVVEVAPAGTLAGVIKLIVVCDQRATAQAAMTALPPLNEDPQENTAVYDVEASQPSSKVPSPSKWEAAKVGFNSSTNVTIVSHDATATPPPQQKQEALESDTDHRGDKLYSSPASSQPPFSLSSAANRKGGKVEIISDANNLSGHFVYVDLSSAHEVHNWTSEALTETLSAKAADYFDIMRPARQHRPGTPMVLLGSESSYAMLETMWNQENCGHLHVIQGCGLFQADLCKCNLAKATAVVIFSAGDRCDNHGDSLSVLVAKMIKQVACEGKEPGDAEIDIVVEVDRSKYVSLFANGPTTDAVAELNTVDWVMEPSFTSGSVICRHMLDTALLEMFYIPELRDVIVQLLCNSRESPSLASIPVKPQWSCYAHATAYALERGLLALGIHRLVQDDDNSFRYMVTNPPPPFGLNRDDIIYCLVSREDHY